MEVKCKTGTKRLTSSIVKWKVYFPRPGFTCRTACFLVRGVNWTLQLSSNIMYDEEHWTIKLSACNGEKLPPTFPLTVYLQDKEMGTFLSEKIINNSTTEIWNCSYNNFCKFFPRISVVGVLELWFDFNVNVVYRLELPTDMYIGNKLPETYESTNCTDIDPCLESLSHDMRRLLIDNSDFDIQLKCGDLTIGAHKLILAARSPVFRNMMKSDMLESRENVIEIVDMPPEVLQIFLRYIYSGTLPKLTESNAVSLYEAADKYEVVELSKRCSRFLSRNLSRENALRILVLADAHSDEDLKTRVAAYVVEQHIPNADDNWLIFCEDYPRLGTELLNILLFY